MNRPRRSKVRLAQGFSLAFSVVLMMFLSFSNSTLAQDKANILSDPAKSEDPAEGTQLSSGANQTIGTEIDADNQPSTRGYKPPVLLDKSEDAAVIAAAEIAESRNGQIGLLIGISVVVVLIMILIAMLAMLLAKGKRQKKGFYS